MKTLIKNFLILNSIFAVLFLVSCGDDDPTPSGEYASGVFIVNEGNFNDGDGSVSFYNRESGAVEQTIFQSVNDVEALGDVIQSAYTHEGLTYLIANNSNKVEVVNSFTFESQFTMTNVALPRYMTVANGKGYLTEWISFSEAGQVSIFDLQTGVKEEEIEVGSLPEDIEVVNNKIYITEAFSSDALYIIDLNDNNTITTLNPGNSTNQLILDAENNVWVACGGSTSGTFPDTAPNNDGKLVKINSSSDQIETSIDINANYAGKLATNATKDQLYFYIGNAVYRSAISANALENTPLFTVSDSFGFYGIGVDPQTENIYVGDAKDFIQDGEVYVYDASGAAVTSFTAGRIPNGFLFN